MKFVSPNIIQEIKKLKEEFEICIPYLKEYKQKINEERELQRKIKEKKKKKKGKRKF